MTKDKKYMYVGIGLLLVTLILSGVTYAVLTWTSTKTNIGINTDCFTIDYTKGNNITGKLKLVDVNSSFITDDDGNTTFLIQEGMGMSYVNLGIKSTCNIEGYGSIYLNVTELSDTFKDGGDSYNSLGYAVLKNTSGLEGSDINITNLKDQAFELINIQPISETGKIKIYEETLSNTEVNKYLIVIFIDSLSAGNDALSGTLKGSISAEANQGEYIPITPDYCFDISNISEEEKTAKITKYNCYEGNTNGYETITEVNIPSTINGYTITSIADGNTQYFDGVFYYKKLTKVIMPQTINYIGDMSFIGNQLTNIKIPDSVITIKHAAFMMNKLENVNIGASVTTIEGSAFTNNKITSMTIPDSVTTIGRNAFEYNNLNYVYIGNNSKLSEIGSKAFSSSNETMEDNETTYVNNPNLNKIYYNGSNSLTWINAINGSDSSTKFVTGTVPSYTSGNTIYNEVLITTGK